VSGVIWHQLCDVTL